MSRGVSFAGSGAEDVGEGKNSTSPKDVGQGGSKAIDFPGNLGADVTHSLSSTGQSDSQRPSGKGEFVTPTEW